MSEGMHTLMYDTPECTNTLAPTHLCMTHLNARVCVEKLERRHLVYGLGLRVKGLGFKNLFED